MINSIFSSLGTNASSILYFKIKYIVRSPSGDISMCLNIISNIIIKICKNKNITHMTQNELILITQNKKNLCIYTNIYFLIKLSLYVINN